MNISDKALKAVAFIGIRTGDTFKPRATCFFVDWTEDQHRFGHLVTAEHVVSGLLTNNQDVWLRVNLVGGGAGEFKLDPADFFYHPNAENDPTDVAVCPMQIELVNEETQERAVADVSFLNLNGGDKGFLPTPEFKRTYMGRGGNVAIIGLFRSHAGKNRNIPVVRVGTIAALPEEPILTKYSGYIDAYLIEAMSIAGLSGSPVLAHPDNAIELATALENRFNPQKPKRPRMTRIALLGLVHGHFDVPNLNEDVVTDDDVPRQGIHTGMGVVVPVEKIVETIQHPDLVAMRKKIVEDFRNAGVTPDVLGDDDEGASGPPATD